MVKSIDLVEQIDRARSYALNAATDFKNIFQPDERFVLASDADEQLILHIEFKQKVTLTGFNVYCVDGDDEKAPREVALFSNCVNPGFDSLEDAKPTEEFDLRAPDLAKDTTSNLRMVKFQKLDSVTIFVKDNNGGETTSINNFSVYGFPVTDTAGKELKKVG